MEEKRVGRKFDTDKPHFSLVPPWALEEVSKVLTAGAQKYDIDNWKYVENGRYRYLNALARHYNAYVKGQTHDEETGLHHMAHLICCAMFILDAEMSGQPLAEKEKAPKSVPTGTR